jgi:hypothetical protein
VAQPRPLPSDAVKRVYAGVLRHFYLQPIHQILWIKSDGTRDAQRRQMSVGSHVVNVLWGHAKKLAASLTRIACLRVSKNLDNSHQAHA